jgi:hypothetical protein
MAERERILETALKELKAERERISRDITELQRLLKTRGGTSLPARTGGRRRRMTAGQRRQISQTMKARWAKIRAGAGKKAG